LSSLDLVLSLLSSLVLVLSSLSSLVLVLSLLSSLVLVRSSLSSLDLALSSLSSPDLALSSLSSPDLVRSSLSSLDLWWYMSHHVLSTNHHEVDVDLGLRRLILGEYMEKSSECYYGIKLKSSSNIDLSTTIITSKFHVGV
jgi:hypothetical protein